MYSAAPAAADPNIVPAGAPPPDEAGRGRPGSMVDGVVRRGFPTPSGRLEFWSSTLAGWGWPEHALPGYIRSHVHPSRLAADQVVLLSTFRLPTQIHTRSANAKWLDELAHTNPVWIHPADAARFGVGRTGDLVRVETEIGHFVAKAWITEGIRPGVVACSHHMGRWRLDGGPRGAGGMMATVGPEPRGRRLAGGAAARRGPYESADPDSQRIWWTDTGVHQNLTFGVHPDPISGMHCWHQAVRVRPAGPGDRHGDIAVDTGRARRSTGTGSPWPARPGQVSPDGTRRPHWLMRPLKPSAAAFALPRRGPGSRRDGPYRPRRVRAGAVPRPRRGRRRSGRRPRPPVPALGLPVPGNAEHTEVFVLNCPPLRLGVPGRRGRPRRRGADRVAGFWRAIGLPPPAEPDHLTALLRLYAELGEAPAPETGPPAADPGDRRRPGPGPSGAVLGAPVVLAARLPGRGRRPRVPGLASWARLVRRALRARARPPSRRGGCPLALRAAPRVPVRSWARQATVTCSTCSRPRSGAASS